MDINEQIQISKDIENIEYLLKLKPFENISDSYILWSIFTKIMIDLRDLVYKSEKHSKRISFSDDIITDSSIKDITDLITYVRNALCHITSPNHKLNSNCVFSYNIFKGKIPNGVCIENIKLNSDYEDDICVFFGSHKIYYHRHIIRAFNECKKNLIPLLNNN